MSPGLNELHLRRGRLLERIAAQRAALHRDLPPVCAALYTTDRLLVRARAALDYFKRHPGFAALAVAALFIMKRGPIWRWTKRGFVAWRLWKTLSDKVAVLALRFR